MTDSPTLPSVKLWPFVFTTYIYFFTEICCLENVLNIKNTSVILHIVSRRGLALWNSDRRVWPKFVNKQFSENKTPKHFVFVSWKKHVHCFPFFPKLLHFTACSTKRITCIGRYMGTCQSTINLLNSFEFASNGNIIQYAVCKTNYRS